MKIMASWITIDYPERSETRRDFIDSSEMKETKKFTYRQPFGIHFSYWHQGDNHNNRRHAPIYLEKIWATKFCPDRNFAWYLVVSEVNKTLVSGHFQNDRVVKPSLHFRRDLEIECLENTIEVELRDNGWPKRTCKMPIYVPCEKITVKHHGGMWDPIKKGKKRNKYIKRNAVRTIQNSVEIPGSIVSIPRVYYCALGNLQNIKLRG